MGYMKRPPHRSIKAAMRAAGTLPPRNVQLETLTKALHSADFLLNDVRNAHSAACTDKSWLLEDSVFQLIQPAVELRDRLAKIKEAVQNGVTQ